MNIFEDAKQGDKYTTKNGLSAEYVQEVSDNYHILRIDDFVFMVEQEGINPINREYDIVKKGE